MTCAMSITASRNGSSGRIGRLTPPEVQLLQLLRAPLSLRALLLLPLPPALTDAVRRLFLQELLRALSAGAAQLPPLLPAVLVLVHLRRLRASLLGPSALGTRRVSTQMEVVCRSGSVCSPRPRAGSARVLTSNHCWARLTRH